MQQSEQFSSRHSSGVRIDQLTDRLPQSIFTLPSGGHHVPDSIIPHISPSSPSHSKRTYSASLPVQVTPNTQSPRELLETTPCRRPGRLSGSRRPPPPTSPLNTPLSTATPGSPATSLPSLIASPFPPATNEQTSIMKQHHKQQMLLMTALRSELATLFTVFTKAMDLISSEEHTTKRRKLQDDEAERSVVALYNFMKVSTAL